MSVIRLTSVRCVCWIVILTDPGDHFARRLWLMRQKRGRFCLKMVLSLHGWWLVSRRSPDRNSLASNRETVGDSGRIARKGQRLAMDI